MFYKAHSKIYTFIEASKDVQKDTHIKLLSTTISKTKILNKENYIDDDKILPYNDNKSSRLKLVKHLSYKFNNVYT